MQQTDKYKLNKPGVDDPIAIAPLNENMDKVEGALDAEAQARAAETADLDQRVTALEIHKIAVGAYTGNGSTQVVQLGFTPKVVVLSVSKTQAAIVCAEYPVVDNYCAPCVTIVEGGFQVVADSHISINRLNTTYPFLALT